MHDGTTDPEPTGATARHLPDLRAVGSDALFRRYRRHQERAVRNELIERHAWVARPAEVAAALGVSVDHVLEAMQVHGTHRTASLWAERGAGSHAAALLRTEGHAQGATDRVVLQSLLRELAPRDRQIVELRFVDELSQSAIAERVGLSQVQVSRLLRRILLGLRDRLQEPGSSAVATLP